jgi:microcystin-dependent protein
MPLVSGSGQSTRVFPTPEDLDSGGREGDVVLVLDPLTIYAWTQAGGWEPLASLEGAVLPSVGNHNLFSITHPDVDVGDVPTDGEVLTYNGAASKWVAKMVGPESGGVPTGSVSMYAGASSPTGWLLCQGQAVSRTTYAALYTALGGASSPYGQGDGSTTFNLPDLRGRAPIGAGQGAGLTSRTLGDKPGAETHTLAVAEMPAHTHNISAGKYGAQNNISGGGSINAGLGTQDPVATTTGGGGAHNNMQPSIAMNFIIKA